MAHWDNTIDASPTKINTYLRCPRRYFYQYEKRYKGVPEPSHAMIRGNALHSLMGRLLRLMRAGRAVPADLQPLAESVTTRMEYPDAFEKMRAEDALLITGWSNWALEQLGDGVRVLGVEQELVQELPRPRRGRQIALKARLDAVIEYPDGSIEHIDYKTGRLSPDPVQELVSRSVIGSAYATGQPIRTTTMFVAHKQVTSRVMDPEEVRPVWDEIRHALRAMSKGEGPWEPNPTPLCEWCPYSAICPAHR